MTTQTNGAARPQATPQLTRRGFVALACACAAAGGAASADETRAAWADQADTEVFEEGGLRYAVLESGGEVSVGTGAQVRPEECGDGLVDPAQASVEVPASVEHGGVAYAVTQVAPFAFQNAQMTQVSLPEGLVKLGKSSFQFCRGLEGVEVPASVKLIGSYAFFGANSLASVTFAQGSALTEVADGAFAVLKTSGSVENSDTRASLAQVSLPASLHLLGAYAFYGQAQLASVTFEGDTLNSISPYCFGQCTSLERVDIPTLTSTIERVGRYAFEGDVSLRTVTFQGGVSGTQTTQGGNEFNGCTGVETVVYYDKKWNAANLGSNPWGSAFGTSFYMGVAGFDDAPNAREYYTVRQYASLDDAEQGTNPTGYAVVPAGTAVHEISAGTCEVLESEGFEAGPWAYECGAPAAGLTDSAYAYPCDQADLTYASVALDAPVGDDGEPAVDAGGLPTGLAYTVWDAAGTQLAEGDDFEARCEDAQGGSVELGVDTPSGYYTLVAEGCGAYSGQACSYFEVSGAAQAWTRLDAAGWSDAMRLATRAVFPNASQAEVPCLWAVVAPGADECSPVALCASSLAGALGAPLLLTGPQGLDEAVSYEVNRVGASNVVIVGDTSLVSQDAEDALNALYVVDKVYRISGSDAVDTAARVMSLSPSLGVVWGDACLVCPAEDVSGAVGAASFAYARCAPVLLTSGGALPDAALQGLTASRAVLVGGAGDDARGQLEGAGVQVEQMEGAFATWALGQGMALEGCAVTELSATGVALAAAALAGSAGAVTLDASDAVEALAGAEGFTRGWVLGDASLVPDDLVDDLTQAVRP